MQLCSLSVRPTGCVLCECCECVCECECVCCVCVCSVCLCVNLPEFTFANSSLALARKAADSVFVARAEFAFSGPLASLGPKSTPKSIPNALAVYCTRLASIRNPQAPILSPPPDQQVIRRPQVLSRQPRRPNKLEPSWCPITSLVSLAAAGRRRTSQKRVFCLIYQ